MENSSTKELISKLNGNLHFLAGYTSEKIGQIVYDALLHMQNTPGATVEDAIGYIDHKSDEISHELYEEFNRPQPIYEDNLPF